MSELETLQAILDALTVIKYLLVISFGIAVGAGISLLTGRWIMSKEQFERIPLPDEVQRILAMNEKIVEMNVQLIRALMLVRFVSRDDPLE